MLVDPDGRRLPAGIGACLSNPLALGGDRSLPNLIAAMMAQKKYSEVIEPLTQELVEKPGDSSVLANRALAYMNSGRSREVSWIGRLPPQMEVLTHRTIWGAST